MGMQSQKNGPRKPKESKWAKDAQEEMNGTQEPASNKKPNDHTKLLREEQAAGPKKPSRCGSNDITAGMTEQSSRKCSKIAKEQAEEGKAHNQTKPSP